MKKIVMFSMVLMMVFASVVVADYDEDCYAKCKLGAYGDCLAQDKADGACYNEAFEPCLKQCPQSGGGSSGVAVSSTAVARPVTVDPDYDCHTGCKREFESCASTGVDGDACEERMEYCFKKCESVPKPLPPMTCEAQCKRDAMHTADETMVNADPAGVTSARPVAFDEAYYEKCVETRCRPQPMDCYSKCKHEYEGSEDKAMECIRTHCEKYPVPPVCPVPSLESGCEIRCSHSYFECAKKADELKDGERKDDVQKDVLFNCRESVGDCLDHCRPKAIAVGMPEPASADVMEKEDNKDKDDGADRDGGEKHEEDKQEEEGKEELAIPEGFWKRLAAFFGR